MSSSKMFRQIHVLCCFLISIKFACGTLGNYENLNGAVDYEDMLVRRKMLTDLADIKSLLKNLNERLEENHEANETQNKEMPIFDIRYDVLPQKCQTNYTPLNCDQATACTKRSGIYEIQVDRYTDDPFLVECDAKTENGGWLLVQRRQDGSEDFYRDWTAYKAGFGNIQGEFFIGLDKLYALTHYSGPQELMIVMEDEGVSKFARYSSFVIGNETEYYVLQSLGKYSGTAGDSLQHHLGMKFTTKDRDNDNDVNNCAVKFMGAWWHNKCHVSNLNGKYRDHAFGRGVNWHAFKGYTRSIQYVKMMIRRRRE